MAHFRVSSDGSIHRDKTKKEKEQQAARMKKQAASQLKEARSSYQNYVSGERNRILSNQNKKQIANQISTGADLSNRLAPIDQLKQKQKERRNKQQEQQDYNKYVTNKLQEDNNKIKYGPAKLPGTNKIQARKNDLEERMRRDASALKQASQTDTAKELKKDVRLKQNEYNVANYLENQAKVDQEKTTNFDRLVNPIVSGLGELTDFSRLTGTQDVYDYETGKRTFLPNRREIKQQKVRRDSKGAWGVYNDVSYNMSKAVGAKILDSVTFGGGTALYYGNMVADATEEARQQGFSKDEALLYGGTVGVIGATLDKALDSFGGLSAFSNKVPTLTQGVDKVFYKMLGNKTASTLLSNVTREAFSEFAEEYADNIAKYMINADASDADSFMDMIAKTTPDAMYSGLIGGISGGVGRVAERNTVDMQERLKALDDYKATLEGIQPQSIPEAQYKEDQLTQVDNQINEINSQIEQSQTAPNTTEQVQTQPQQQVTSQPQTETQKIVKPQEQVTIKPTEDVKKQGQLQMVFSEETNKAIQQTEKTAKEIDLPKKQTQQIVDTYKNIDKIQNNQPSTNYIDGNVTYTKDGIKTSLDEKMVNDVIRINEPNKNPQTITLKADGQEMKLKKPSSELAKKSLNEQIQKYTETLPASEKKAIEVQTKTKIRDFTKAKETAIKNNDTKMLDFINKIEKTETYKATDIDVELFKKILQVSQDIDKYSEAFQNQYINDTIGSKDGTTPTKVSSEVLANGQAIFYYQLEKGNVNEAFDTFKTVKRYGTQASQSLNQMKALYQTHPLGVWIQAQSDMDTAFQDMVRRKGLKWKEKHDPMTNKDSKFKFSNEESMYILKESMELYDLHGKDFEAYNARKGELQQFIADKIPMSIADQTTNWIRSSLLLGTRTVLKNTGSNLIDTSYHAVNKAVYTIADRHYNRKFGTDIRTAGISIDGTLAGAKAGVQTSLQTAKNAFYNFTHGTSISTEYSNKFTEATESRDNFTKDFFNTMPTRYQTNIRLVSEAGNRLSQLSNDVMSWGDAKYAAASYADNNITLRYKNALEQHKNHPSKNIVYNEELDNAGTTHVTYITPEGKVSKAITNDINTFMEQNNMERLERTKEIDDLALKYSEARTYVGDTTMSKETTALLKKINDFAAKVPGFKQTGIKPTSFIVPFSKIGSNLVYKAYRGSILAIPSIKTSFEQFKSEVDSGKVSYQTQYDLVSRVGDIATGTMAYVALGAMAKAVFDAEGGEDEDDKKKAAKVKKFMNTIFGKDEYTFKIGDKNIKFDVGGNLTNMLKIGLDLQNEYEKQKDQKDKDVKKYLEVGLGDMLSEWTVSNITDLFNNEYDNDVWSNLWATIARVPSMAIPNIMKDFAMQVDNFTERSVWDEDMGTYALNSVKAKIPVWRGTLPAKTDSWGNVMKSGSDMFSQYWNNYVSSGMIKKDQSDGVSQELMQMYLTTNKAEVIPNSSKGYFSYKGKKYELNDKEEEKYLKTYAQTAYNKLDKLFYSKEYQDADTDTKLKYIKEVYQYANDEAKKEYLNTKNVEYYNYGKKVMIIGEDITFKQAAILDAVDNNISYEAAKKYQEDPNKFKLYNSFGSYEYYKDATNNIVDIRNTYKKENGYSDKERKSQVINYVSSLNNLSAVQKAILIKEYYPASYKNYNGKIKEYLQKQNLDMNTYTDLVEKYKLNK